jgi:hypothetical protein
MINLYLPQSEAECNAILAFYGALSAQYGTAERVEKPAVKAPKTVPVEKVTTKPAEEPTEKAPEQGEATGEKSYTLEDVRAMIAVITERDPSNRTKIKDKVRELGYRNLPAMPVEEYPAIMTFIQAL